MSSNAHRHLHFIGDRLKRRQAAVLVGAGFSRNAEKADESIPDSPTWPDLARVFQGFLSADGTTEGSLSDDPLVLAEQVEALYGRHELDRLLSETIRDLDYLPSALHKKLLRLPWSDIFTTNYDTLLERASEKDFERLFRFVRTKEDLVGTSDATRIVKLHGSFPSNRPFIITTEDYRTYPQRFAAFVNTIQQTLLEKTLCLIGFSGTDPNFLKWTGWIRDNLGIENMPNIYLLLHYQPSEAETILMQRRHIIPVDLSALAPEGAQIAQIYEMALDDLLQSCNKEPETGWKIDYGFWTGSEDLRSIEKALQALQDLHKGDPGWLVIPKNQRETLQSYILDPSKRILLRHCQKDGAQFWDQELEYLYEYDWLRERSLLPPFPDELQCYQTILQRHSQDNSPHKIAILLSLLRDLHESGEFAKWRELRNELEALRDKMEPGQQQRLHWEDCLCAMARYAFEELSAYLEEWQIPNGMPVWALRRAGLLAECGRVTAALESIQQTILEIRRMLSSQKDTNVNLLSTESALIELKKYLQNAAENIEYKKTLDAANERDSGKDPYGRRQDELYIPRSRAVKEPRSSEWERQSEAKNKAYEKRKDEQRHVIHMKYHVAWREQNLTMTAEMESVRAPFPKPTETPSFDFGVTSSVYSSEGDTEAIKAFAFLRFREETGIPFFLNSVRFGTKAARGAAERIARYSPEWSILTLVRAGETKGVETTITRSLLSQWTCEQADRRAKLYLEALRGAEKNMPPMDGPYRRNFVRLAADTLPEVLSELCTKCTGSVLDETLDLVEMLYGSEKKRCFPKIQLLVKRLLAGYPKAKWEILVRRLLNFPAAGDLSPHSRFPEPLFLLPDDCIAQLKAQGHHLSEAETLWETYQKGDAALLNRVIFCAANGLLPEPQRLLLRDMLWQDGKFTVSDDWYWTVCLQLPVPQDIDLPQYASARAVESMEEYSETTFRLPQDVAILEELNMVMIKYPNAFSTEQASTIIQTLCARVNGLLAQTKEFENEFGMDWGVMDMAYYMLHSLWLLLSVRKNAELPETDRQLLQKTYETCQQEGIYHYGFACVVTQEYSSIINVLSSGNEQHSRKGYDILAAALTRPQLALLPNMTIQDGVAALCQQLRWRAPGHLPQALQLIRFAILDRPELLSEAQMDSICAALDCIRQETEILCDDSIETASRKGILRVHAAKLAKCIREKTASAGQIEILDVWQRIISDPNEFAEIRNA